MYIEQKNYITDILNNSFQPDIFEKSTGFSKALHTQQEIDNEIKELNDKLKSLIDKNGNLKSENKTF